MKAPRPRPGYHDRGMLMRAYPTPEQVAKIEAMQPSLRAAWNWLVSRVEEPLAAHEARLVREGLIPSPIPKPHYTGMGPEEAKATKEEYHKACAERRKAIFSAPIKPKWRPFLSGKDSEAQRLGLKHGYQVINNYLAWKGLPEVPALILQSLEKNFSYRAKGQSRKQFRREYDVMPIQVRSGHPIHLRSLKPNAGWYQARCNAEAFLPGIGWIACYLHTRQLLDLLEPGVTIREGCTLRFEAGRWYASVKIIRRVKTPAAPNNNEVAGIDPGLSDLATTSDSDKLLNHRNLQYADARQIALSVAGTTLSKDSGATDEMRVVAKDMQQDVYKHDARQRRRTLTQTRQFIAALSKQYQFIGVEKNEGIAIGLGSRYVGFTKGFLKCLIDRCGADRVVEVEAPYNSQDCSACGHRDKEAWQRKLGQRNQVCKCPACGIEIDRDVNAARNTRRKCLDILIASGKIQDHYPCGG